MVPMSLHRGSNPEALLEKPAPEPAMGRAGLAPDSDVQRGALREIFSALSLRRMTLYWIDFLASLVLGYSALVLFPLAHPFSLEASVCFAIVFGGTGACLAVPVLGTTPVAFSVPKRIRSNPGFGFDP